MAATDHDVLLKEIEARNFRPVYLLMGDEPYFIDLVADKIEETALGEAEKAFNQTVFYGKDTDAVSVIHEASQYPMMAERRVVIVKEAQELAKLNLLEKYVEHYQDTTVLVICHKYKTVDKRLRLVKLIDKVGAVMESKKFYDNQMPTWIAQYAAKQKLQIDQKSVMLLAEALGTNLSAIVSAFEKLRTAGGENLRQITPDLVEKNIGVSKEYNVFELRDALIAKNVPKANKIVKMFSMNEKQYPIQSIIPQLFTTFEKLFAYHYLPDRNPNSAAAALGEKPFMVQRIYEVGASRYSARKCMEIIDLLREYDMRSKGFAWPAVSSGELLRELVFRILN